ncbi:16S rRNA (cytosine(967)-C(5))-methyltransferase RsmB [Desulfobacterales bacterium HSG2]|nr:16S rRNA (cytosine(967)-C(5))-methyltransferase RsmB [Desulfobacterales bacterium HSG2]
MNESFRKKKNPRETALSILNTVDKGRKTLDNILNEVFDEKNPIPKRDRSLINALVYGVLRWRGRLDWIIGHFSKTRLNRIEPEVLNILRIGLFQVIYLDRIPVSAAVNTSVEMAKSARSHKRRSLGPWVARFVNGVLRNAVRGYETVPFPDMDKDPLSALAAGKSFPKWLIKRWLNCFGIEETGRLCDAINTIPPITVRTNTLKTAREDLIKSLEPDVGKIEPAAYSPDGVSFFNPKVSVPEMKAFKDGWFQVQDEAAQLVTSLLEPHPGDTVLDACAGLGGKTGHIAQMMKNQGRIVAMDKDSEKLERLGAETKRLGISIVETCAYDLEKPFEAGFPGFDRILLDAPCSGLGVLRRNPDIKWSASEKDLSRCRERQTKFLDHLARLVRPSGVLVYAVCSTEPEENEEVVTTFLERHPELSVVGCQSSVASCQSSVAGRQSVVNPLKTFPHLDGMDGFFSVCFFKG